MKVLPIVAFYLSDFYELIKITDNITRITHNTIEARLSAILITLRYRQILLGFDIDNLDNLLLDLNTAIKSLNIEFESKFFVKQVKRAQRITKNVHDPSLLLQRLSEEIGIEYLAWSTPVTACFWSYRLTNNFDFWFNFDKEHTININKEEISYHSLKKDIRKQYSNHLRNIKQYSSFMKAHRRHWQKTIDIDTLFSIAFSLVASKEGIEPLKKDIASVSKVFKDNLESISAKLIHKKNVTISERIIIKFKVIHQNLAIVSDTLINSIIDRIRLNLGIKGFIIKLFKS